VRRTEVRHLGYMCTLNAVCFFVICLIIKKLLFEVLQNAVRKNPVKLEKFTLLEFRLWLVLEYFRNLNFLQFCTASDTINDVSRFLWHQLGLASCELHDLLDGDLCKKCGLFASR